MLKKVSEQSKPNQGQGQSKPSQSSQQPPQNQAPQNNQANQNKSPSSSQTSTNSNTSGSGDPKLNPNLFNMFGTNIAPTQQQPTAMQKQNSPGTAVTNPTVNANNKDNFGEIWANPASKPGQQQPPVIAPANKNVPPPIQPLTSPQNKPAPVIPTQQNSNTNTSPNNISPNSAGQTKPP